MTAEEFNGLRTLENHRVRMTLGDGQVLIATLLSITTDLDGSRHVVYDKVEWSALPHLESTGNAWYVAGEDVLSCIACSTDPES